MWNSWLRDKILYSKWQHKQHNHGIGVSSTCPLRPVDMTYVGRVDSCTCIGVRCITGEKYYKKSPGTHPLIATCRKPAFYLEREITSSFKLVPHRLSLENWPRWKVVMALHFWGTKEEYAGVLRASDELSLPTLYTLGNLQFSQVLATIRLQTKPLFPRCYLFYCSSYWLVLIFL